jgi:hypothetical protein
MQTAPNPKPTDDPHDILVVAPGVAVMVPTDEELSKLARSLRHPPFPQAPTETHLPPEPTVPPVDTTFRPTAVGDVRVPGQRTTTGGKAARALTAALVVAACTGGASIAWQSYGDAAETMIAQWAPQRILALLPLEKPTQSAQQPAPPAVEPPAANAEPASTATAVENTTQGVAPAAGAPSAETAPSQGSMANELASARHEIEQLKATIADLKASQQQVSRDMAKTSEVKAPDVRTSDVKTSEIKASPEVRASEARMSEVRPSEQNLRPKMPAHPPRTVARARKPMPPIQQAATAPMLPPPPAAYMTRQVAPPPLTTGETLTDPELASVPRPPMPVR